MEQWKGGSQWCQAHTALWVDLLHWGPDERFPSFAEETNKAIFRCLPRPWNKAEKIPELLLINVVGNQPPPRKINAIFDPQLFFSPSSLADVALKARSLHVSKQEIQIARTKGPWSRQIDEINKNKNHNHTKQRRPTNLPARLAFRQRKQRSKQQKQKKTTQRSRSPNKNTH